MVVMEQALTETQSTLVRRESYGTVRYANEVIATIAGLAAADVPGVAGMCGNFMDGVTEIFGKKNFAKGIQVEIGEQEVAVHTAIVVEYGKTIPVIAQTVRANIIQAIETMTGLKVAQVNVHIQKIDVTPETVLQSAYA